MDEQILTLYIIVKRYFTVILIVNEKDHHYEHFARNFLIRDIKNLMR